ncbi:hypothetical protein A0H81_14906 [Grifola frondosa]|uniref:Uncharacterized protein n=1 Tax=Grifola frondosa TaxID=5627 RepID=A0A1C7LJW6_GRIFR|nr:hypothetical protein A0H81_14906 [Grifola frondosa]
MLFHQRDCGWLGFVVTWCARYLHDYSNRTVDGVVRTLASELQLYLVVVLSVWHALKGLFRGDAEHTAIEERGFRYNPGGKLDFSFRNHVLLLNHASEYPESNFVAKAIPKASGCQEFQTIQKLLRAQSPRNHTVLVDLVDCPNSYFVFMPFLARSDPIDEDHRLVLLNFVERILEDAGANIAFVHRPISYMLSISRSVWLS